MPLFFVTIGLKYFNKAETFLVTTKVNKKKEKRGMIYFIHILKRFRLKMPGSTYLLMFGIFQQKKMFQSFFFYEKCCDCVNSKLRCTSLVLHIPAVI